MKKANLNGKDTIKASDDFTNVNWVDATPEEEQKAREALSRIRYMKAAAEEGLTELTEAQKKSVEICADSLIDFALTMKEYLHTEMFSGRINMSYLVLKKIAHLTGNLDELNRLEEDINEKLS